MKKSISLLLCLVLIFSSFSFSFATATSWDTADQANLQGILRAVTSYGTSNLYYYVSQIYSLTNTISNNVNTIKGYLVDSGYSISYWVHAISTWMSPIYNAISSMPTDLFTIIGALGYYDNNNTYHPYLTGLENLRLALTNSGAAKNVVAHSDMNWQSTTWNYRMYNIDGSGNFLSDTINWNNGSPLGNIALMLQRLNYIEAMRYRFDFTHKDVGWDSSQTYLNWSTLNNASFTPQSEINGIYTWLSLIQTPVARLSYVLASDQRIEAQELAADNEQAVVDNFIDSTGSGAASTSDFDSIADFSSGYKSTFASDASPTGIFDIFNSNNMGWFSQETANQLDTTNSNNRAKSDNTFNTPLLDQQINSIYEQLGVKQP